MSCIWRSQVGHKGLVRLSRSLPWGLGKRIPQARAPSIAAHGTGGQTTEDHLAEPLLDQRPPTSLLTELPPTTLTVMQRELLSTLCGGNAALVAISFAGSVTNLASVSWLLCGCAGKATKWGFQKGSFVSFTTVSLALCRKFTLNT